MTLLPVTLRKVHRRAGEPRSDFRVRRRIIEVVGN
jgi:hypothetical protein